MVYLDFPKEQYKQVVTQKNQIVLHHTGSGSNAEGVARYWKGNPKKIATGFIIDASGELYQLFDSKYCGYHLGVSKREFNHFGLPYKQLNFSSIGLELTCWGALTCKYDKFYNWVGKEIPKENVQVYEDKFRGEYFYEKYTDAQLERTARTLKYWNKRWDIPLDYNEDMWAISKNALMGKPGIYTHVSYRLTGKWDCHPQPELIQMLKSLK
jgi:N-acetyl-anhydromuramyl-L-alanine amidase AmpD